ncbi:MAG TPA: D-alanyl-D-alanine carboxypeptidase/D-alanyl-D-alanine-endopeptidase [Puia sp.]|jgi:D-alanyl-D-alanine carboxypeptidase/D-alanyl-D-alanine-endopeptidase (penicillin-binding protein 4)|nr:D-alanyl-D-alanine carboxypeptidase/D-alanyl-D-alanine-endopeptidase [Puia sp.]
MMYRLSILLLCLFIGGLAHPQRSLEGRLREAMDRLQEDSSMRHATISLCVSDAGTGVAVFERNSQVGLAPASCQKLFTSVAALDLLGPEYRYTTRLGYRGKIAGGILHGDLVLAGSGDPTLGSWRFDSTKEDVVLGKWIRAIRRAGITGYDGSIVMDDGTWGTDGVPAGWIWEDIGNYYGAGAWALNWHENQYDVRLQAGKTVGDPVIIVNKSDLERLLSSIWVNELKTGPAGSGDNAYIFLPSRGNIVFVRGTAPLQKEERVISGSFPWPAWQVYVQLQEAFKKEGILHTGVPEHLLAAESMKETSVTPDGWIGESVSPPLDSINYWFLRRSINLYGEALIRTLALEKTGTASTEGGVGVLQDFWSQRGIDREALHIMDGSGLSPQNRVTTDALVRVLRYARSRPWYHSFYNSLPVFNGIHMKSGSIGGARSFSGYQTGADGKEYVFSIIVNNYNGPSPEAVRRLYGVLDLLKQ